MIGFAEGMKDIVKGIADNATEEKVEVPVIKEVKHSTKGHTTKVRRRMIKTSRRRNRGK